VLQWIVFQRRREFRAFGVVREPYLPVAPPASSGRSIFLLVAAEIGSGSQHVREVWQSAEHPIGFASCGAAERQRRLRAMTDLFIDWPDAFVSAGSRFLRVPRRIAPRAPTWFTAALRAARGDRGEIRTARLGFWSAAKAEGWLEAADWLTRHRPYEQWWITR
jgi:hypothetical protein